MSILNPNTVYAHKTSRYCGVNFVEAFGLAGFLDRFLAEKATMDKPQMDAATILSTEKMNEMLRTGV